MSDNSGQQKQTLGRFGEDKAVDYLISRGYTIIERNFRCRLGEIDIIASKGKYIVFAEVKLRKNSEHGTAAEFITYSKQRKVRKAAEYYLVFRPQQLQPRFDAVEVYAPDGIGGDVSIHHIEDAFGW